MPRLFIVAALAMVAGVAVNCRPARYVPEGQRLLMKTELAVNKQSKIELEIDPAELLSLQRQKPIRKILRLVPFHVSVWNYAHRRNADRKFIAYLSNNVGESPVVLDTGLSARTARLMADYLSSKGYFDATASYTVHPRRKKKAAVSYTVETGPAYRIKNVNYVFEDTALIKTFSNESHTALRQSTINRGDRFDTEVFDAERDRIATELKNLGYFSFEKIHVSFEVDTTVAAERVEVWVRLRNQRVNTVVNGRDTVVNASHRPYTLANIYVNENFESGGAVAFDTLYYRGISFLFTSKPYVKPSRLEKNIYLKRGDTYSLAAANQTYERISALANFRFIDLKFTPTGTALKPELDATINLTHSAKQSLTIETTGTNRSGNLGISAGLNYRNKNLLGGAEILDWNIYGGLEAQRTNSTTDNQNLSGAAGLFNTFEYGVKLGLTIPDLIGLPRFSNVPIFKEPKTKVALAYDRQFRPQYDRDLFNASLQYVTRFTKRDQFVIAPVDVSVIDLNKSAEFEQQLAATNNSLLINTYNNHIIAAGRLSYNFSSQDLKNPMRNFFYTRLNAETAGWTLRQGAKLFGLPYEVVGDERSYLIDSIAFADYLKFDADYIKNINLSENTKYLVRGFVGVGIPRKNLNTLPFDRSFFGGGANGIRAWQARGLGPGVLADTTTFATDQVGDLQLECNLEYRFGIINQIKGALFLDLGNIWLLNYDPQRPGAEFMFTQFYKQLAVAPGAGLRADLSFFVLRFDAGMQLHDPALPAGERWAFQPKVLTNQYRTEANILNDAGNLALWRRPELTVNIAINYPF